MRTTLRRIVMAKNKSAATTRTCSRCHTSLHLEDYDGDETICRLCLDAKPRGQTKKDKGQRTIDKQDDEVWKYCDIWGSEGVYL